MASLLHPLRMLGRLALPACLAAACVPPHAAADLEPPEAPPVPAPPSVAFERCEDADRFAACTMLRDAVPIHQMDTAVSERSIAVAWTIWGTLGVVRHDGSARLAIMDEHLVPLHQTTILAERADDIAIAPWREAWAVAVTNEPAREATIVRVSRDGRAAAPVLRVRGTRHPTLTPSPGGPLLLVWYRNWHTLQAALLEEFGAPTRWTLTLHDSTPDAYGAAVTAVAVDVDGGFLIALQTGDGAELLHVGVDGTVSPGMRPNAVSGSLALGSCGPDAQLLTMDHGRGIRWRRLDGRGHPSDDTVGFQRKRVLFHGWSFVCRPSSSILLLHTVHGFRRNDRSDHLELLQFDHEGNPGESLPLVEPSLRNGRSRTIDPLDDDVVLSWVDTRYAIGLARIMSPFEAPRDWLVSSHR